jgi:ATP-dependent DNA helicase RecG
MTPVYLENILKLSISDRRELLLAQTESQWFERKGINIRPADIARPIIAFANAEGGALVLGVSNGKVSGLVKNPRAENSFRQAIHDYVKPPIKCAFDKIAIMNSDGKPDEVIFITVNPADVVYEDQKGDCFLRVGDDSRELNFSQRQELEYNKGVRQYDGEIIKDSDLSDLDGDLVEEYAGKVGYEGGNPMKVLTARFLANTRGEQTNACHLLFSSHPQDIFPQSSIRITKFFSDERGTGANLNIDALNDYRMDGNIPTLIRESTRIIDDIITKRKALGADGEFIFQDIIPRDAWREGVVNALVHRSYSLSGDYVHVELYPTRVEITSPGVFPGLAKIDDLLNISRFARNPRVARVCTEFGFGQELGEGIKRIVEQMRKYGYIDPVYTQNSGNVKLCLEAVMRLNDELARELPTKSEAVLNIIRLHKNGIGTGEIMEQLEMTRPTASLRLKKLEEKGLIEHIGKTSTDPRAIWVIAETRNSR